MVKQDHASPSGLVGEAFASLGWDEFELTVVPESRYRTPDVQAFFPSADLFDAIVLYGAPWSVYDTATIGSWIGDEIAFARSAVSLGVPVLGICFGGQVLAAAGMEGAPSISVPMISGRSLGHTGGTLDKLETIPGFDSQLSLVRMGEVLRECHAALVGQTPRLVPADRILYGMRDHTGTVESPFLICASIMSKKLAEDLNGLVLDVKVGSGAFMPTYERSKFLAELMVSTGEAAGTRTAALLTTMDEPMGRFSGNWVEVWECVDVMKGVRHAMSADLIELSNALSGWMLYFAGKAESPEVGAELADTILRSGAAYAAWLKIVAAQGGDVSVFDDPAAFHKPKATRVLRAPCAGYLADMDCKEVGWAVQRLGAGRTRPGDPVSAHAGIESHAKLGDWVGAGQPVFTLFCEDEALLEEPYRMLEATVKITDSRPERPPLVHEVVTEESPR